MLWAFFSSSDQEVEAPHQQLGNPGQLDKVGGTAVCPMLTRRPPGVCGQPELLHQHLNVMVGTGLPDGRIRIPPRL